MRIPERDVTYIFLLVYTYLRVSTDATEPEPHDI